MSKPTKKKPANGKSAKLSKSMPGYYALIGSKGGKATKKAQPKGYFSKIAVLSHRDRERSTSPARPEADGDQFAGPRDKTRSRTRKTSPGDQA